MADNPGSKAEVPDLIPARMLAEFTYCPRLCYIEWIDGEFVDNEDTADGRFQHRRVDKETERANQDDQGNQDDRDVDQGEFQDDRDDREAIHLRSVSLTGAEVGVTCRIDLLEKEGKRATPVEYKRGRAPDIPEGAYEPDRVQLCSQGLVLRENGFQCDQGVVYFVRSKKRVQVPFDKSLVQRTRGLISELRRAAIEKKIPPPLEDSPKCNRCSLAGICLPDEVNLLREMEEKEQSEKGIMGRVRKLIPARDDSQPVYVIGHGNSLRKKGDVLEVWSKDEGRIKEVRLREISQVNLYGAVDVSTPALVDLMQRGIPVLHFTRGGWFQGMSLGHTHKNVELRMKQFEWAADRKRSLTIARSVVSGKIKNCRTQLRRNDPEPSSAVLESLDKLSRDAKKASSAEKLLGIEGAAADLYFGRLDHLLKEDEEFSFQSRNRRPPKDPVNAVLSYLYAVLAKEMFVTLLAVGFDPYLGFYHRPRYGRPALALDMMEEFRPVIADSTAITLFNKRELNDKDFIRTGLGISLTSKAKKTVIGGYERQMEVEITHPIFGYAVSYRRIFEVQARLLSRVLFGEIKEYPAFSRR